LLGGAFMKRNASIITHFIALLFASACSLPVAGCGSSKAANAELGNPCSVDAGTSACGPGLTCIILNAPPGGNVDARCSTVCHTDSDCAKVSCPTSTVVTCDQSAMPNVNVCGCTGT
jgi:hypothetical protein